MGRKTEGRRQYRRTDKPRGRNLIVKESNTLLPFLFEQLNQQSKSSVKSLLKHGQIQVNGRVSTHFDAELKAGDTVGISYERGKVEFSHPHLRILLEDQFLLVVDKKEGLLSAGNSKVKEKTAFILLKEYLKRNDPRAGLFLLNPLDKETSGLMIFAKNKGVQQYFLSRWNEVIIQRGFVAVVEGILEKSGGLFTTRDSGEEDVKVVVATGGGHQNIVRYKLLKNNGEYSLIELFQEAGKKVEIRERLADQGCPIVGDTRQGATSNPLGRVALHATKLCFFHPETQERMDFVSHIPPVFNNLVKKNIK